jgi:hypothetical protein
MSAPHENRRLKMVGLVLIGVASPALLFLQNQTESPTWLDQDGW